MGVNVPPGMRPALINNVLYFAGLDGTVMGVYANSGLQTLKTNVGTRLAAGVGGDGTVLVVGSEKGDVIALEPSGAKRWTSQVKSSVLSPPHVTDGVVIVQAGDGTVTGLDAKTGALKWTLPRTLPPLTVRNHAGVTSTRRAGLLGTAGGRVLGFDTVTGVLGWESVVATPRGTTELDRLADVISQIVFDERAACATAYQGRTACFDLVRGTTIWTREIASRFGVVAEGEQLFVVDDKFVVHALDRSTGATVWKQDALTGRRVGHPAVIDGKVVTFDYEGFMHVLDAKKGTVTGRSLAAMPLPVQPPISADGGLVWQTEKGTLFSVSVK
jgi:outer membrane protein assembly factor BamB